MKSIIIFEEKHGNRYFDASTEKLRNAACLKILKERFEGFWYDYSNEKPSDKNILSDEQIAQLPTENLKTQESRKRKDYLKDLRQHDDEVSFYKKSQTRNRFARRPVSILPSSSTRRRRIREIRY